MANKGELQYRQLLQNLLDVGNEKGDRTGTGVRSLFGEQIVFYMEDGFPLITSKFTPNKLTIKELLYFITGSSDTEELEKVGVNIWKGNTTKEFLEKRGLKYKEKDQGPMYGHQWRHAGAEYKGCHADYTGEGIDQLQQMIDLIKEDPDSRRIVMSTWNVADLPKMCIAPCHCLVQFYVANKRLSCKLYQRSADMFLGVPINIASYALLTMMIAHITDTIPDKLIYSYGDYHIYNNTIEQTKQLLKNEPKRSPKMKIVGEVNCIDDFKLENFVLEDYEHCGRIKADMAV